MFPLLTAVMIIVIMLLLYKVCLEYFWGSVTNPDVGTLCQEKKRFVFFNIDYEVLLLCSLRALCAIDLGMEMGQILVCRLFLLQTPPPGVYCWKVHGPPPLPQ